MAQYEFCAQAEPGEPPTDLVTYRILPDDSIEQIDAQPAVGLSTRVILVDPRANWVYTPHSNELGTLFQLQPDGTVASKEALEGKFYENSHTGLRPDGEGFIGSETFSFSQNIFLRYYEVTNDCEITPAAASLDLLTNGGGLFGFGLGISQVGNFTILGQNREFYRVYHMDPDGTIHPPTPDVQWGTRDEYDSRTIDVSRDGRLMISYGAGDLFDAVSMWVNDNGTVTQVDTLSADPGFIAGGARNVLIAPHREWVIFQGAWTECWNLLDDGRFGSRKWVTLETVDVGRADLSGDGRVLIVSHLTSGWNLSVVRLSTTGELESITTHPTPLIHEGVAFITRRVPGDTNGDGWLDITDVVTLINHVNDGTEIPNPVDFDHADVDRDGDRDDADVQTLVDLILTQVSPLP